MASFRFVCGWNDDDDDAVVAVAIVNGCKSCSARKGSNWIMKELFQVIILIIVVVANSTIDCYTVMTN